MNSTSNNSLALTPGQGGIATSALTPGVGGDAKPKSRGCNHESSKAKQTDRFKPPPLAHHSAFRVPKASTNNRSIDKIAMFAAQASAAAHIAEQKQRRRQAVEDLIRNRNAVYDATVQRAIEDPEWAAQERARLRAGHWSPLCDTDPHLGWSNMDEALKDDPLQQSYYAALMVNDPGTLRRRAERLAEEQAARDRAISRRNAHELREQSARERAAREVEYDSPSEGGSCQPPKTPVKYGGFTSARARQDFHGNAMSMTKNVSDAFFSALLDAKSKAEKHFDNATLMVMADYEQFGSRFCDLSPEQKNARDVLESTRAMAEQSLQAIQAKIDAMSKIGVMST